MMDYGKTGAQAVFVMGGGMSFGIEHGDASIFPATLVILRVRHRREAYD